MSPAEPVDRSTQTQGTRAKRSGSQWGGHHCLAGL